MAGNVATYTYEFVLSNKVTSNFGNPSFYLVVIPPHTRPRARARLSHFLPLIAVTIKAVLIAFDNATRFLP